MAVLLWTPQILIVIGSMFVLSGVTLAGNLLCIGSDNIIDNLYLNGEDVTKQLANRNRARKPDCIKLPLETQTIAIKARNLKDEAGISYCQTNPAKIYRDWHCLNHWKAESLEQNGTPWYADAYETNVPWKRARWNNYLHKLRWEKWLQQPCQARSKGNGKRYFWAVETHHYQTVACRISYCRSACKSCDVAGPGKCDPGMCTYGTSTVGGVTDCNHKCCIDIKTWAAADSVKTGYARVTNQATGNIDEWSLNEDGRYIGIIDMDTCTFVQKSFSEQEAVNPTTYQQQNTMLISYRNSAQSPNLANTYGLEMSVGGGYSPWIALWEFGTNKFVAEYGGNGYSRTFSACLTGRQKGKLTVSDVVGPSP